MLSDFDASLSADFVEVARARGMLDAEQAMRLRETSLQQSVPAAQLAIELGFLSPMEVEIVEAFLAPKDLAPGYELLDVVGYGALGVVYRARQTHLHRDVAIKSIMRDRLAVQNVVARFQQEGTLIGRLQHPNIINAYDFGSHRNRLYLVMELVDGFDLSRRLDDGSFSVATSLALTRQIALGLAHALSHRIIHRDIKPGNLLLTEAPAGYDLAPGVPLVKIADFGLARFHQPSDFNQQDTRLTVTGAALGTPMYCAPEQLSGDEIDHRADIYALGATFFRMLSGHSPYASDNVSRIIAAKVTGQLPRMELLPPDLDSSVRQLLLDMMQPDPEYRIAVYGQLIARIDSLASPQPLVPTVTGKAPVASKASFVRHLNLRRRVMLAIGGIAMLCLLALPLVGRLHRKAIPSMVPSGWEQHLFDGKTITGWTVRSGVWTTGSDSEGGAILIGRGTAIRGLPSPPDSQTSAQTGIGFRIGVDLQKAKVAEIHFAIHGDEPGDRLRSVVQLSPKLVTLGKKQGLDSKLVTIGKSIAGPQDEGDQPLYHDVRVERHGSDWFAFFDDQLLGSFQTHSKEDDHVIQLVTDGIVHFEGPRVYQLDLPTNPSR